MLATTAHAQLGSLERLVMPGLVAEAHAELESECSLCHARFDRGAQRALCLDCHEEIAGDLETGTGFHSLSPGVSGGQQGCSGCHTDHEGRDADILGLDRRSFDHALTDFPLRASHAEAECEACHLEELPFHAAETECIGCHADDDRHLGRLGTACESCHVETVWSEAGFDHSKETAYALTGAHAAVSCAGCHADERYEGTSDRCVSCHAADDVHDGTNGAECQSCHATREWAEVLFDHVETSGFALAGSHAEVECDACHVGNKLETATPTDCIGCHADDDVHGGVNGTSCEGCHRESSWLDVSFDHGIDTRFALRGAHAPLACESCHLEPVADALPGTACIDCHAADDPHAGQLGEDCAACHADTLFTERVRFDHDLTRFPLLGRHEAAECADCHETQAYLDAPETCVDCHAADDAHDERLGADCGLCHTPNDWRLWVFDHGRETDFALDGAHETVACAGCHREPLAGAASLTQDCGSCHRGDDVHRGAYGQDCERCHTTSSFADLRPLR